MNWLGAGELAAGVVRPASKLALCPSTMFYVQGAVLAGRNILETCVETLLIPLNSPSLNVILDNKVKQNAQLIFTDK